MNTLATANQKHNHVALFTQVSKIAEASELLGPKVTNIAIVDPTLDRLAEVATLVSSNKETPGAFAQYLVDVYKAEDAYGRARAVVRTGFVKQGLVEWSTKNPDLMRVRPPVQRL